MAALNLKVRNLRIMFGFIVFPYFVIWHFSKMSVNEVVVSRKRPDCPSFGGVCVKVQGLPRLFSCLTFCNGVYFNNLAFPVL